MEADLIVKGYQAKKTDRSSIDGVLNLIEKYVVPFRGNYYLDETSENSIDWRRRGIYDSTAVRAAQVLAASIQGGLFSTSYRWFEMYFENKDLNNNIEARQWLEECATIIYNELQNSNFDTEASEFCLDLVSFATATITEEESDNTVEKWEGINFKCISNRDSYYDLDADENVIRWYRRLKWNPVKMVQKFGLDAVPDKVKDAYKNNRMGERTELVFCIYLRDDKKKNIRAEGVLAPTERPYGCKYVIVSDSQQIGPEMGYYEMPTFITKWRRTAGSDHGHSPAFVSLSDILTLNQIKEETLTALGKVVDPATIVTERGLLSDLDLGSGGLTVARSKEDIWVHESKARFDVGELKIQDLQQSIDQAFYIDQLQMKQSPSMTATEVQVRYEMMQRLIGPTYGRIKHDFLDKVVERTFNILYRAKRLPVMPEIVKEAKSELKIEYTGPIPRSQQLDTVRAIQNWVGMMAGLYEIKPEVLDNVDWDKFAKTTAIKSGVPADMMATEDVIKNIRDQRKQQQARAQEAAIAEQEGKAMKAAGEGVNAVAGAAGVK